MHGTGYLNEEIVWASQPSYVKIAFTHGLADKVLLHPGTMLCKLSDFPTLTRPGSGEVSPWWSPLDAYQHDAGWEARKKLAEHFGVSIRELSRILVAVKENWNAMNYLLKVRTIRPIYGFYGGVSGQTRLDTGQKSKRMSGEGSSSSKKLVGSASQFYIPNLNIFHVNMAGTENLSSL